ncbi:cytochrome P450 [Kitasatospora herbaricolor]|uniref:cytochrome P450 n=1 Tax=Kitasatospora herbaricolor TaxID=68217 RepID=UPI0036D7DB1C
MTSYLPEPIASTPGRHQPAPPPGCPAHDATGSTGPGGLVRLYGPAYGSDPAGVFERLRQQHGAVAPVLLQGDVPAWLVLAYDENMLAARTPSRFSRDSRNWRHWQDDVIAADSPLAPVLTWRPDCVSQDGAEHQRLRAAVTEGLARFDRRGIRRHIQRFANQLIDQFAGTGSTDLLTQYAQHLPMLVLTHLFGMPEEEGPRLVEASTELVKGTEAAVVHNAYIMDTLRRLVEHKKKSPGHDFTSWLLEHHSRLTDDEVLHHLWLVMLTANESVTNLVANTLRVVLTDPRFRASLAGGLMTVPDAVEQVLWDEPPVMTCVGGYATTDTELGGRRIRAGDLLLLGLAAGNTDPLIRPDPSAPVHGNRSHLAFSRGPHECPGQDIGRAITDIAVDTLLVRLPDARLGVAENELSWTSSTWSRHLNHLPVIFTPLRPVSPDEAADAPHRPVHHRQAAAATAAGAEILIRTQPQPAPTAASGDLPARRSRWLPLWRRLRHRR